MDVDSAMLAVVDFVVTDYWITIGTYLNSGQSVAVNVVVFDEAASFSENVDSTLMPVVDLVPPDSRI